ncbi:DNA primase [Rickettsia endosymbiont of Cardiosporidium cionae]|uniref:DNA primase n=1 Tax=Rickettsia endosymbiont of Cardiosporidium cionae TaxID=2777155 RepID=UPI001894559A|nr:DNA primase [Rickettsia endosymbiont of Cardiosporidium cionae]KAF8818105.1 DNA primase [Rickettsia endosymbiont of Cardiosporidium cionae]
METLLDFYDNLRSKVLISDVIRRKLRLDKKGREYIGLCPFHNEKTASFTVNDQKGFYHCFGCHAHGDVIKFISSLQSISYKESAVLIAREYNISIPRYESKTANSINSKNPDLYDKAYNILELAARFFQSKLNANVKSYLFKRGLDDSAIEKFSIGFAAGNNELIKFFSDKSVKIDDLIHAGLVAKNKNGRYYEIFSNRIIFPISNDRGRIVGFGGRVLCDSQYPKYLNSPETLVFKKGNILYRKPEDIINKPKSEFILVVEGYLDVISLSKLGIESCVAILGTAFTEAHLYNIWKYTDEVVICFDGDIAGNRARDKLIQNLLPCITINKKISFIELGDSVDPSDIVSSNNGQLFFGLIKNRLTLSQMIWKIEYKNYLSCYTGKHHSNALLHENAESKAVLYDKLMQYCTNIKDRSLCINFRRYFKNQIWNKLYKYNSILNKESLKHSDISDFQLTNIKNYSEIESVEYAIFAVILKYPQIMYNNNIYDFIKDINFVHNILNEFRDWICEQLSCTEPISQICYSFIEESVKNTRFYDTYLVVSKPNDLFLDISFAIRRVSDSYQLFELFKNKRYLILLKQDYKKLVEDSKNNMSGSLCAKLSSYLEEIERIAKELDSIDNF